MEDAEKSNATRFFDGDTVKYNVAYNELVVTLELIKGSKSISNKEVSYFYTPVLNAKWNEGEQQAEISWKYKPMSISALGGFGGLFEALPKKAKDISLLLDLQEKKTFPNQSQLEICLTQLKTQVREDFLESTGCLKDDLYEKYFEKDALK